MSHDGGDGPYLPGAPADPSHGYGAAISRNELFSGLALHRAAEVLEDGEKVLLALPAVASDNPKVLMVTTHRVVLSHVKGLARRARALRSEPSGRVRGVSFGGGAFSPLTVRIEGARDIRMMPHRKTDAARFAAELEQLIHTGRPPVGPG